MMTWGVKKGMPVVVQGMTGHQGRIHTSQMREFGTNIVAGVVPGKGGMTVDELPVFSGMAEAIGRTGATTSVVFVPAAYCLDAAMEALESGIQLMIIVTEHVPVKDAMIIRQRAKKMGASVIGPNCPGICLPGIAKLGIMPNQIFSAGNVGVISRSGTLTYELVQNLTDHGIGQRCCIGIGGDPVVGMSMPEMAEEFCRDGAFQSILLIGEIGGRAEIQAAERLNRNYDGPIFAYMAGRSAPPGKRMGHAGAIMARGMPNIDEKEEALRSLGVTVCRHIADVGRKMAESIDTFGQ